MRLPVDISAVKFAAGSPVKPVVDFATKTQKVDENGGPLFRIPLYVSSAEGSEIFPVKIAGEPKGLTVFQHVKVTGLVAESWDMGGSNHGIAFRADSIEPLKAAV